MVNSASQNNHHNLQHVPEHNPAIRAILSKSADSREYLTDEEVVTLGVWITRPENTNLYGFSLCLPPNLRFPPDTLGLFRVEMDETQFFWQWDSHQWDYDNTTTTTSHIGNKILKTFNTQDRIKKAFHRTIYKIEGPEGTIIVLVLFQMRVVPDDASDEDRQVKPVKDIVCLSDPDIIAVSNHPFPDGGKSPFEATKDGKVIDLEDGIEPDDIFNSSFSKKLMDILRKPYDENEFLRLYDEASLKRPLTRSRQLRDGREIGYKVEDQLALSYLEMYKDFNKKYHRYRKDLPRALNLLRGFFFYLENIVLEGAFKPWLHEKRLTDFCFDARECKAIVGNQ